MADKPLYYGSSKNTPMYYGSSRPMYGGSGQPMYGGKGPMYYGARQYGSYGNYGNYGSYGQYGQYGGTSGDDGSLVGTITLSRTLRVISQRWLSIFVFVLVGLIVSFAVYRISPTIYEAAADFTMDMRRTVGRQMSDLDAAMPDLGQNYAEIFNTRLPEWRSEKIVSKIVQEYRSAHPASTVADDEIISTLGSSQLELQRNSRLITITVRSTVPALAASLANAYAEAIEAFTDDENKVRCDKAVSQIHQNVEKKRREVDKVAKQLLDFRTANKVDNLRSTRDTNQQALQTTTSDILALEREEAQLVEWEKMLAAVQKEPESFGTLSTGIPRAQDIATEYRAFQDAAAEYAKLQFAYTENHPEVIAKAKELETARDRFLSATERALQTGRSTLQITRNQLANLRAKQEDLRNELSSLEQRIVLAESGLGQLEAEFGVANRVLEGLILDENKARIEAESNNEIVRVARRANIPSRPVLPNPMLIFGVGIALSLVLGLFFVLVLDNLEDTIVNLRDIEGRLSLKVLAVLPHVRLKHREQVAKFAAEDKYSQFSETVAGLRNLFDSPRYEAMTRCILIISTQPGEGKTITSTSIAISYAQAGKKVLHVDFDLRRPRLAKVWDLKLTEQQSFSHTLQRAVSSKPDFAKLVSHSSIPGLDVIASLPPEGVAPSSIFGSAVVADFFEWAKANYDRVIIDAPPFGVVGDVVSLAMLADSVVIMCRPDRTHFKPIQFCSRSLTEAGANILGVIVNDVEVSNVSAFSPSHHNHGYGYGYGGYGYGYGYRPHGSKKKKEDPADKEEAAESGAEEAAADKPALDSPPRKSIVDDTEFTDDE